MCLKQSAEVEERGPIRNTGQAVDPGETPHYRHVIQCLLHGRIAEHVPLLQEMYTQHCRQKVRLAGATTRLRVVRLDQCQLALPRHGLVHLSKKPLTPGLLALAQTLRVTERQLHDRPSLFISWPARLPASGRHDHEIFLIFVHHILNVPTLPLQTLKRRKRSSPLLTLIATITPGGRSETSASTNHDEVAKLSARRLRQVLAEMVTCDAVLTVANLCQTAGISRTALYRYHSDVLRELKEAQRRRGSSVIGGSQQLSRLRSENDVLKAQLMEVAALVDHNFAAWQEASVLIKRQEDELSSLRKQVRLQLASINT